MRNSWRGALDSKLLLTFIAVLCLLSCEAFLHSSEAKSTICNNLATSNMASAIKMANISPMQQQMSIGSFASSIAMIIIMAMMPATVVHAAPAKVLDFNDISRLKYGLREVEYLIDNWDEKTTYCNFGEFQRELLLPENKEKLMKAAAETGLLDYDKSKTMNVMCRKDPEVVRGLLGLTPENTLLNQAEVLMKKPAVIDRVDPENIDEYIDTVERYTTSVAAADGLAYQARTDYASQMTDSKEKVMAASASVSDGKQDNQNYLAQAKDNVVIVRDSLRYIVSQLHIQ